MRPTHFDEVWTAPDLSISATGEEMALAWATLSHIDWDDMESRIPAGAVDAHGVTLDRNNRYLRLGILAESLNMSRRGKDGEGWTLMDNPHYRTLIESMLDAFDKSLAAFEG